MTFQDFIVKNRLLLLPPLILVVIAYAPVFPRMFGDWSADPNYSHGFLVPLISAWFAYKSWPRLKSCHVRLYAPGLFLTGFGVMLLTFGVTVDELYTSRSSFIFILAGTILTLFGPEALRILALPLCFLFFMIPWPYTVYNAVALPLKSLVAALSTGGLKLVGIPVLREGNMILLPNMSLEVVEACSGMRSLVSLAALGTAYAFVFLNGSLRRALLIVATVPIAVFTNVLRVFITGALARSFGPAAAEGFFHDFAGFLVFAVAMILTVIAGWGLNKLPFGAEDKKCA